MNGKLQENIKIKAMCADIINKSGNFDIINMSNEGA